MVQSSLFSTNEFLVSFIAFAGIVMPSEPVCRSARVGKGEGEGDVILSLQR